MPSVYLYSLASVAVVSLISLIGVFTISISLEKIKKITMFLVSLSAGTLLGDSFIHLMPEVIKEHGSDMKIWGWLMAGIIVFFILEKIIHWRHCHIPTSNEHQHHLGAMNLAGDALHNMIDGMLIAGSFLINTQLGVTTTIAVIAHEIPQEIGDFGVLIYAGYSRAKALTLNFLIALTSALGAVLTIAIGSHFENFSTYIIPFTAGGFIYIATADLIPELNKETQISKSLGQLASILLGIAIMLLIKD